MLVEVIESRDSTLHNWRRGGVTRVPTLNREINGIIVCRPTNDLCNVASFSYSVRDDGDDPVGTGTAST